MSTSEKWSNPYSSCPCGKGEIVEDVDSPDNPWSRTIRQYRLVCDECNKVWILHDKVLRNRSSEEACSELSNKSREIRKAIEWHGQEAIDEILISARLATSKEEYALLHQAKVCIEGPIRYKRARLRGQSPGSMCDPIRNLPWIIQQRSKTALGMKIEELTAERDNCEEELRLVARRIISIPIESLLKQ